MRSCNSHLCPLEEATGSNEVLQAQGNSGKVHSEQMIVKERAQTALDWSVCDDGSSRVRQKGFSSEELCGRRGRWRLSLSRWTPAGHYQGNTSPKRRKLHDKSHELAKV